ncbi:CpsD/CapB family tyrosine-protein kinase [Phaeobacter marinintestinus]|uniref:CpsD/CapB family tyrosine-protein kinase n=1 Tax=Falsiphaeobacter marinintestinus TaxID=1492905 RepID=UPI0011B56552|nr:CpsD/CapB family tyrosine-protein kinase [Phaeobacter marinintestinus]
MKDYVKWADAGDRTLQPNLAQWEDQKVMSDDQQESRIFRRKAANRKLVAVHQPEPEKITEPVQKKTSAKPTVENLPVPLPEDWNRLHQVRPGVRKHILGNLPLISFFRDDPAARAFDLLRSRLLQGIKSKGWKRVAIAAPTKGCGATFTAVNLALSLARIPDSRVVLMDLNMRDPGVASALDIHGHGDMHGFLRGDVPTVDHLVRVGDTLALGLADSPDRFAAELLHGTGATETLEAMVDTVHPDVVICDLPAVLSHDDFVACLAHVDCVLLVSDAEQTTAAQIAACEEVMGDQVGLLGVVLNRARRSSVEDYDS